MSSDDVYVNQVPLASQSKGACANRYQEPQLQQADDAEDTYEDIPMVSTVKPMKQTDTAENESM